MAKLTYCPVCGSERSSEKCLECGTSIPIMESKQDIEYYLELEQGNDYDLLFWDILVKEEISKNPYFNPEEHERTQTIQKEKCSESFKKIQIQPQTTQPKNVPKCPTCQSTNLRKISDLKRATHGIAFGFISKTAWSQFECKNCGYKW